MRFRITRPAIGKARPKVPRYGKAYMPKRYQEWMRAVVQELGAQASGSFFETPVCVRVSFDETGADVEVLPTREARPKYNRKSDIDNMAGAVLDALQQAEIIENDRLVHRLEVWFNDGTH